MIKKSETIPIIITTLILLVATAIGAVFTETSFKSMYSLAFAILFYIILPGYCVLLNLNMSGLERIIFGMAVSVAIIPITLYTLDILGIALSTKNVLITISIICAISILLRKRFNTT